MWSEVDDKATDRLSDLVSSFLEIELNDRERLSTCGMELINICNSVLLGI